MRPSLAGKKVLAALAQGDPEPLLAFHRAVFGDARMADDDGTDGEGDDGDDDPDDSDDGDDQDDAPKGGNAETAALKRENAERRKANAALKKQNEELNQRLKAIEDKDKGELEKATGSLTEAQTKLQELQEQNMQLLINNAFLSDNTHNWANPKAALRLADLSDVEIDDEGNVTGLKEALDALAKSDPYLLAKAKSDDDDDDDDKGKNSATGQPVGKKSKGNPNRDKLLEKYPALRR